MALRFAIAATFAITATFAVRANELNPAGLPASPRLEWSMSIRWENDTFGGTDRFYTDGVSLSLAHTGDSWLDPFANRLPWGGGRRTVGYEVGQIMVTPANTRLPVPDPMDRPYAGILYAALSLHVDRSNSYHGLKFIGGVIGPWSLAEETQREVHRFVGAGFARGWDHQLENEPLLNLVYEHRRKYRIWGEPRDVSIEAIPSAGAMLGNMLIQGQVSGQLRVGYNLPDDFGATLLRGIGHLPPPRREAGARRGADWGLYVFVGASANFVARDITLDGNTFESGPRVDKKWFVPAGEVGICVGDQRFQAGFTYVFWSKEFEGQSENAEFGALAFSFFF